MKKREKKPALRLAEVRLLYLTKNLIWWLDAIVNYLGGFQKGNLESQSVLNGGHYHAIKVLTDKITDTRRRISSLSNDQSLSKETVINLLQDLNDFCSEKSRKALSEAKGESLHNSPSVNFFAYGEYAEYFDIGRHLEILKTRVITNDWEGNPIKEF